MRRPRNNTQHRRRRTGQVRKGNKWSLKAVPRYHGWVVGDLVTIKEYCKDSGRLAILTELPDAIGVCYNACKIQWADEEGLMQPPIAALLSNLIKIGQTEQ